MRMAKGKRPARVLVVAGCSDLTSWRRQHYAATVEELAGADHGGPVLLTVEHEHHCRGLRGAGACNCTPTVQVAPLELEADARCN